MSSNPAITIGVQATNDASQVLDQVDQKVKNVTTDINKQGDNSGV